MSQTMFTRCVCCCALALAACSKNEPAPSTVTVTKPVTSTNTPPSATAEPPAESSLSLKRGTLSMSGESATFQPCGERAALWLVDQTDGVLRQAFSPGAAALELYVEAHGERTRDLPDTPEARAYSGAFTLEEVLYAAPSAEVRGCQEAPPTYVVAARGNEPFWAAEVFEGRVVWRQPEEPKELVFQAPQSEDAEGTVGYKGSTDGHTMELLIDAQQCRDSMSGAFFAYSARATFDGKELKGCARVGE